jgi:hypothetical protein
MERFIQYVAAKRGMIDALRSIVSADSELYAHTREQIVTALRSLLCEAAASGAILSILTHTHDHRRNEAPTPPSTYRYSPIAYSG